jgi:hypothetical protein
METIQTLSTEISQLTRDIEQNHPELLKYLDELPISIPSMPEQREDMELLREYRDSLKAILARYSDKH